MIPPRSVPQYTYRVTDIGPPELIQSGQVADVALKVKACN
jgi:hypothetical protein